MSGHCFRCGWPGLLDRATAWCAGCTDAWRALKNGSNDKETVQ